MSSRPCPTFFYTSMSALPQRSPSILPLLPPPRLLATPYPWSRPLPLRPVQGADATYIRHLADGRRSGYPDLARPGCLAYLAAWRGRRGINCRCRAQLATLTGRAAYTRNCRCVRSVNYGIPWYPRLHVLDIYLVTVTQPVFVDGHIIWRHWVMWVVFSPICTASR